jgi:hypothetical protein
MFSYSTEVMATVKNPYPVGSGSGTGFEKSHELIYLVIRGVCRIFLIVFKKILFSVGNSDNMMSSLHMKIRKLFNS